MYFMVLFFIICLLFFLGNLIEDFYIFFIIFFRDSVLLIFGMSRNFLEFFGMIGICE